MKINEIVIEAGLIGKLGNVVSGAKEIGSALNQKYKKGQDAARTLINPSRWGSSNTAVEPAADSPDENPSYQIKQSLTSIAGGNKPMLNDKNIAKSLKNKIKIGTQKISANPQQSIATLDKIYNGQPLDKNDLTVLTQLSKDF